MLTSAPLYASFYTLPIILQNFRDPPLKGGQNRFKFIMQIFPLHLDTMAKFVMHSLGHLKIEFKRFEKKKIHKIFQRDILGCSKAQSKKMLQSYPAWIAHLVALRTGTQIYRQNPFKKPHHKNFK